MTNTTITPLFTEQDRAEFPEAFTAQPAKVEIAAGQMIVIDGEILYIGAIKGRWVKLSDDTSISRAAAIQGRADYLEDAAVLGDELDDPENADEYTAQDAQDDADDEAEEEKDQEAEDVHGYTGPMVP